MDEMRIKEKIGEDDKKRNGYQKQDPIYEIVDGTKICFHINCI